MTSTASRPPRQRHRSLSICLPTTLDASGATRMILRRARPARFVQATRTSDAMTDRSRAKARWAGSEERVEMIRKQPWFERQFPPGLPVDLFPVIVERLRGTPARLEDRLSSLPVSVLTRRSGSTWSSQENAGHLLDLEPLWLSRGEDLLA